MHGTPAILSGSIVMRLNVISASATNAFASSQSASDYTIARAFEQRVSDRRLAEGCGPQSVVGSVSFRVAATNAVCRWFCVREKAIDKLRGLRLSLKV